MLNEPEVAQQEMELVMIESLVPGDHPLQKIDAVIDLEFLRERVRHSRRSPPELVEGTVALRKSPCHVGRGFMGFQTSRLEQNLQAQLHIEGFTGADARGSVKVADGVGDHAAARTGRADA